MPTIKKTEVSNRIKQVRMSMGLTQKGFADHVGITQGQVSHMELGKTFPGLEIILDMCSRCGLTLAEFLDETAPQLRPPAPPSRAQKAVWLLEEMHFTKPVVDRVKHVLEGYSGIV